MPSAAKDFIRRLMSSREELLPALQAFPSLDLEQIASNLQINERGAESGKVNRPEQHSTVLDVTEGDILGEIERRARKAQEDYRSQMEIYEGRIRRVLFSPDKHAEIVRITESSLTDFRAFAINDRNHLERTRRLFVGAEQEVNEYRQTHNLKWMPVVVSRHEKWVRLLVIAILILIESVLNGFFFAQASTGGIIGGVGVAIGLSVLNVGVAFMFTRVVLPSVFHTKPVLKAIGIASIVIYGAWALGINLFTGHYRDLFIQHEGNVDSAELLRNMTAAPFRFGDVATLIQVGLGLLLAGIAIYHARRLSDRLPAYGELGTKRDEAEQQYLTQKQHCLSNLIQLKDQAMENFEQVIQAIRTEEFDLRLALEGRGRLHENFRTFLRHLSDCNNRLLRRYYEANVRARTEPAPDRFETHPEEPIFLREPALPDVPELGGEGRKEVVIMIEKAIKAINLKFEEEAVHYQAVTEDVRQISGRDAEIERQPEAQA